MSIIEHDYGDDSHCRVCNAFGPNEDHIPCTANVRATPTDRAAIEALARELDDAGWRKVFAWYSRPAKAPADALPRGVDEPMALALLAYLDGVWAGLTKAQRSLLNGYAEREQTWTALRRRGLALDEDAVTYEDARRDGGIRTPLGRAVLRRAKEQGHG